MEGYVKRGTKYEIPKVDFEIIKRLSIHDVAKISDSMGRHGTMHNSIKSRKLGMRLYGRAITVYATPGSYETVIEAAKMTKPGMVLVVAAQRYCDSFAADSVVFEILKKNGASGILVDGAITDDAVAVSSGIGVFAKCLSPKKVVGKTQGEINIPLYCGGMLVFPGDYIVGDDDGTVAIPYQDIERVIQLADEHLAGELSRVERTNKGEKLYQMNKSIEKCRNWRG